MDRGWVRDGVQGRAISRKKVFFFEKKNQKTFACSGTHRASVSDRREGAGVKVFWFFFSKKNIFLPSYP
jgi:hypothetical protein